ncbi:MAG TPA: M28 family peptidase [Terriglobales bacterium]|nr:M28 family peptidase [Terriglobales bacterium]
MPPVCARCIRAHMDFLASDALRGRGSGTHDELVAATYIASELEQYGLDPAGDSGGFIQRVAIRKRGPQNREIRTWNVIGRIVGTDAAQQHDAILLTAHLDHLGVGRPVEGDVIYNGADDDASGTTAVLELARVLAAQSKPRRTLIFALFGGEEKGRLGSIYFRAHPPVPLSDIAAYLEFEMIGRADPALPRDTLWLTGWHRTNLGPELAKHGAHLVADPHPAEDFFRRSDNYVFAKQGVVAQTVSSYGLHPDYHQPSDDLGHIDFQHMDEAIESMLAPITWLANSDFVPHWNEAGKP